eukprot:1512566-Rhodomonas_salina.1
MPPNTLNLYVQSDGPTRKRISSSPRGSTSTGSANAARPSSYPPFVALPPIDAFVGEPYRSTDEHLSSAFS